MKRTPIDDIGIDQDGRHILDSADKIIRWINYHFEEQKISKTTPLGFTSRQYIDLSNCVVGTYQKDKEFPLLSDLFDFEGKLDCFINTLSEYPHKTRFYQEVHAEIFCKNSIIYNAPFLNTKFYGKISLLNTTIINGEFGGCEFLDNVFINDCQLSTCSFWGSTFHRMLSFIRTEFNCSQIDFSRCTFMHHVALSDVKFKMTPSEDSEITFNQSTFKRYVSIKDTEFPVTCSFNDCNIQLIALQGITSKHLLTLKDSVIHDKLLLLETKHSVKNTLHHIDISNLKIIGRIDIENSTIGIFQANFTDLHDKGILRLCNNTITICDMDSIYNRGIIIFEHDKVDNIILDSAINVGVIELENTEADKKNIKSRKTARILKDSAYRSNNLIDGLKYRALELKIYKNENKLNFFDRAILFLNKWSNNYDQCFAQGILFTMGSAAIFFWLINYFGAKEQIFEVTGRFNCSDMGEIWKRYLDILNVLNFRDRLDGVTLNGWGATFFFLSKIVVAYGMYQTIAAFRKYRQNQ